MTLLGAEAYFHEGTRIVESFSFASIVVFGERYHGTEENGIELTFLNSYSSIYPEFCNSELQRNASKV